MQQIINAIQNYLDEWCCNPQNQIYLDENFCITSAAPEIIQKLVDIRNFIQENLKN